MTAPAAPPARATLYWSAVWRGAVSTMMFAVPVALAQEWLRSTDGNGSLKLLLNLVLMGTGALGGFAAARLAPSSLLQNGAAAAALAAFTIQLAADLRHALVGDDLAGPIAWIFVALLMSIFGMFGGWLERRTTSRPLSP